MSAILKLDFLCFQYGRIVDIELKNPPRPPGYCFVEVGIFNNFLKPCVRDLSNFRCFCLVIGQFESSRDADDAIRGRDGYNFDGYRLRVLCNSLSFVVIAILICIGLIWFSVG